MTDPKATYTQEEVNAILRRALEAQARRPQDFSGEDLSDIAKEAGIDEAALREATAAIEADRCGLLEREEEGKALAAERAFQLRRLGFSAFKLSALNGLLYVISTQVTGGTWYLWPLLGSALFLGLRARHACFPQALLARRRRRQERLRRKAEWAAAKASGTHEFERIVKSGVATLLEIAARKIEEHGKSRKP